MNWPFPPFPNPKHKDKREPKFNPDNFKGVTILMPQINLGATHSTHRFKLCARCDNIKPPEGGIEVGVRWNCQACWLKRITGVHLKQNRINGGTK